MVLPSLDWEGAKGKPQSSLSQIRPLSFLFSLCMGVLSVVCTTCVLGAIGSPGTGVMYDSEPPCSFGN